MIRIYGFHPQHRNDLTNKLVFSYNHQEYTQLTQSLLRHDLFCNEIGPDLSGQVIELVGQNQIDGCTKAILITNDKLAGILKPFEAIQKAGGGSSALEALIVNFLRICSVNGYDVLSTSELSWKYGE